ncbi:MAG: RidA family protein [Chloroflexota bacterium]|nr:RidA family protein [Chloroflexota bacterium]MED5450154.1 RidA family protein [Chloroflexota bacterium]
MGLEFVNPENAPPPAANYSNLAIVPKGYRLLVIAGQIGNLADGSIVEGLEAQYEQAISNINTIVASEGGDSKNIARITVFLAEKPTSRDMIGAAMEKHFPGWRPAMSWIYVSELFSPDVKVEIEAIAAVP